MKNNDAGRQIEDYKVIGTVHSSALGLHDILTLINGANFLLAGGDPMTAT